MSGSKLIGLLLSSAGAVSILGSVLNAAPGAVAQVPGEVLLRLGLVIGLSLVGAVLLALGAAFLLCTGPGKERARGRRT